jgi:integrative and conjugative element protein (TIGR02256 family)
MGNYEAWTKDVRYGVRIPSKIFNKMLDSCRKSNDIETGGILVGYYNRSHDCAIVIDCSGPPKDSKHGRNYFHRGIQGLQNWIDKLWNRGYRRYYLGEWHYHPFAKPEPSSIDFAQMKKNAEDKSYNCPEPIMVIVGGDSSDGYSLRTFVCTKDRNVSEFFKGWKK